jgi:hypothetical protein
MSTHELKTWPKFFDAVRSGEKPFEVRKNDRGYAVGDTLWLREYVPEEERYTGRSMARTVSYVLHGGEFGIHSEYCVLGLMRP